jgi:hypothetical protein
MSRNGSGTYSLPAGNPVVTGTTISSTWANNTLTDIATALTGSLAADGQTTATGNLKMGANRITGLADGIASTDGATVSQVNTAGATYLLKASNLSDVANAATSRTNLGLGTIATQSASSVAVTGGAIDGTTIGTTTPSTVKTTGLTVTGSTSGTLAIAATAVAGTNTATFPAATGTVMVSGNMPAFSAYASSNTTLTNATFVKVDFQTEEYDTNNNFASSRFTPTVAGYYLLQTGVSFTGSATGESEIGLYKNGSGFRYGMDIITAGGSVLYNMQGNWLVYANGSTDYFEIYMYQNSSRDASASQTQTYFTGAMVRSA